MPPGGICILVSAWAPPAALPRSRLQEHCPCSLTHLHVKASCGQHEQKKNIAVLLCPCESLARGNTGGSGTASSWLGERMNIFKSNSNLCCWEDPVRYFIFLWMCSAHRSHLPALALHPAGGRPSVAGCVGRLCRASSCFLSIHFHLHCLEIHTDI